MWEGELNLTAHTNTRAHTTLKRHQSNLDPQMKLKMWSVTEGNKKKSALMCMPETNQTSRWQRLRLSVISILLVLSKCTSNKYTLKCVTLTPRQHLLPLYHQLNILHTTLCNWLRVMSNSPLTQNNLYLQSNYSLKKSDKCRGIKSTIFASKNVVELKKKVEEYSNT